MDKRTIARVLKRKHNEFVKSIKSEKVRDLVDKNSIITGGSIASMLLGEKVNDFDYYFTDIETVKAVAAYYCQQFAKRNKAKSTKVGRDLTPKVKVDNNRVRIFIKSAGVVSESKDTRDYEFFENCPEEIGENWVDLISNLDEINSEAVEKEKPPYRPIYFTSNAITLSNNVQLIVRFYGDADAIHENFDFVHCTNYWVSATGKVTLRQPALESLLSKQLYYVGSKYPLCSVFRTRKFIKRGWHINAGQYVKMAFQISQLDLTDINTLEDQLVGVDNAYFQQLIQWFRKKQEKDPDFKITQPYVMSVVDKIFGMGD